MNLLRSAVVAALALVASLSDAYSQTSTINPNIPAQNAPLQSAPIRGQFGAAINDINALYNLKVNRAGDTLTGLLITAPASAGGAGLNLAPGTAPSSPNNGDIWTTSGGLFVRINGSTIGPLQTNAGSITVGVTAVLGGTTGHIIYDSGFVTEAGLGQGLNITSGLLQPEPAYARFWPKPGQSTTPTVAWNAVDIWGNPINCSGTTSQCFNEFSAAVSQNGWGAEFDCQGVGFPAGTAPIFIDSAATLAFKVGQDADIRVKGTCILNIVITGSASGITVDSEGASVLAMLGVVVYAPTAPNGNVTSNPSCAILINPTTPTLDGFAGLYAGLTSLKSPIVTPLVQQNVTGAVSSGGLIELTVASTSGWSTGDTKVIAGVGGVPNATGAFVITVVDSTHITLQNSTFAGSYTSGGTITGVATCVIGIGTGTGSTIQHKLYLGEVNGNNSTFYSLLVYGPSPTTGFLENTIEVQQIHGALQAGVQVGMPSAVFTGTMSGTVLTVSAVASGTLAVGQVISGPGVSGNVTILSLGSGSGGTGTYNLSSSQSGSATSSYSTNVANLNGNLWIINNCEMDLITGLTSVCVDSYSPNDRYSIGVMNGAQGGLTNGVVLENTGTTSVDVRYSSFSGTGSAVIDHGTCNNYKGPNGSQTVQYGSTSGCQKFRSAAVASGAITWPAGTTDFSSTGGTSQVVQQASAGAPFTVGQLSAGNLSNGTTGIGGNVVLSNTPTLITPNIGVATATSIALTGSGGANEIVKQTSLGGTFTVATLTNADLSSGICNPVVNILNSGTNATYTTPTCNGALPKYIELTLEGGGAGGDGGGSGSPTAGTNGNPTCWNTSSPACTSPIYQAGGGAHSSGSPGSGSGCDLNTTGGSGGSAILSGLNTTTVVGGAGGTSFFGGNGLGVAGGAGGSAGGAGSGGAGGGGTVNTVNGSGGSSGGFCYKLLTSPASSYTYTVGTGGTLGSAGTNGFNGGNGANGLIQAIARWQ